MNLRKDKMLTTNALRMFIKQGGKLRYKPVREDDTVYWLLVGVHTDGYEQQFYVPGSGSPKSFRNANAIYTFHKTMFPDAKTVEVPYPDEKADSGDSI